MNINEYFKNKFETISEEIDKITEMKNFEFDITALTPQFLEKHQIPQIDKIGKTEIEIERNTKKQWNVSKLDKKRSNVIYLPGSKAKALALYFRIKSKSNQLMIYRPTQRKSLPFIEEIQSSGSLFQCNRYVDFALTKDEIDQFISQMCEKIISSVNENIIELNKDISSYNSRLNDMLQQKLVEAKANREKLFGLDEKHDLKSFGLSEFKSRIDSFDLAKEKNLKSLTTSSESGRTELLQEDYEDIILTCSQMSSLMTRSANTLSQLNENDISSLIVLILNMIYKNATGSRETFNFNGKTDIILKIDEFVQFIGEAKIWNGWEYIKQGLDTLIKRYCTQFDTKLVLPIYITDGTKFNTVVNAVTSGINEFKKCNPIPFGTKLLEDANFSYQYEIETEDNSTKVRISFIIFDLSIR